MNESTPTPPPPSGDSNRLSLRTSEHQLNPPIPSGSPFSHYQAVAQDDVPASDKFCLGLGFIVSTGTHAAIHVMLNTVYNVTLGVNPAVISSLVFIQRIWTALLQLVAGHISDNLSSRWGRRKPMLLAAVPPMVICFALIWLIPAHASHTALVVRLTVCSLLFYTALAFYTVPLLALQIEATSDYHERTRVSSYTQICTYIIAVAVMWILAIAQLPLFHNLVEGVRCTTVVLSFFFLIAASAPLFCSRRIAYGSVAKLHRCQSFFRNLREVSKNRPFMMVLGMRIVGSFGYCLVTTFQIYLNYYYVCGGDVRKGIVLYAWTGLVFQAASIGAITICRSLAARYEKARIVEMISWLLVGDCIGRLFLYNPTYPWLQLIVFAGNGACMGALGVLTLSMLADVVDYDELQYGARREGMFGSVFGCCNMVGEAVGILLSGFLLVWTGFDAKLGGAQTALTLQLLKFTYASFPFLGAVAIIWIARRYPLGEERLDDIKSKLVGRREAGALPRLEARQAGGV